MFTGLVQELGRVHALRAADGGARIEIAARLASELREGDSVAVNGVCLTATQVDGDVFAADVMGETLRRSSLGALEPGAPVNLELPLRPADRLGGHFVQGHVDGVGTVKDVREDALSREVEIEADPALLRYVAEKGSIAVDGVSLTVTAVGEASFRVSLIPETLERTTLGDANAGGPVNLEVDLIARYLDRLR